MGATMCTWFLALTFLYGISQAYFNNVRPPSYYPGPRYESCRESIEDLKALVEITQCLKPDPSCVCPVCTSTLSEEIIIKLVNALIYAATQNCGFNGRGGGGIPVHNGASGHPEGGHIGTGGETSGSGTPVNGGNGGGLLNVGVLDGQDTLHVDVGGKKVVGLDLGPQTQHGSDGLVQVGVLNKNNSLLNVGLGGQEVLGVNLGKNRNGGGNAPGKQDGETPAPVNTGTSNGGTQDSTPVVTPTSTTPGGSVSDTTQTVPTAISPTTSPVPETSTINKALANTATGVAQQDNVLPANKGIVGSVNNTVVNQGTAVPTNVAGNSTPINSPDVINN